MLTCSTLPGLQCPRHDCMLLAPLSCCFENLGMLCRGLGHEALLASRDHLSLDALQHISLLECDTLPVCCLLK